MKSGTQVRGSNWTLDGDTITMFIPMMWKLRGGRKVIIDGWQPKGLQLEELMGAMSGTWGSIVRMWESFQPAT